MTRAADLKLSRVVAEAASGDEVAFARIVAAYNGEMRRVCVVVARDRSIAEEAVQSACAPSASAGGAPFMVTTLVFLTALSQ